MAKQTGDSSTEEEASPPPTTAASAESNDEQWLLNVRNLAVEFASYGGTVQAVRGISFGVRPSSTLAIVGESGCGKSVSVMSLLGLIPMPPGRIKSGQAWFQGKDLLSLPINELNTVRGADIAMIFQDPMAALNPTMRVGAQIAEPLVVHQSMPASLALVRAVELLERSHISEASVRAHQYPFQHSGGMQQRAMIATALSCGPSLLIADEPTTALDVTIEAQILTLLQELQRNQAMSILLITHDLGVVARMADDVAVMYAGQIVETGTAEDIFYRSAHPYTLGLRQAMPVHDADKEIPLKPIDGSPPDLFHPPRGCGYFARCPYAAQICETRMPPDFILPPLPGVPARSEQRVHKAKCWLQHSQAPQKVESSDDASSEFQLYRPGGTRVSPAAASVDPQPQEAS